MLSSDNIFYFGRDFRPVIANLIRSVDEVMSLDDFVGQVLHLMNGFCQVDFTIVTHWWSWKAGYEVVFLTRL